MRNKVRKRDVWRPVYLDGTEFLLQVRYGVGGLESYWVYAGEDSGIDLFDFLRTEYQGTVEEEASRVAEECGREEVW